MTRVTKAQREAEQERRRKEDEQRIRAMNCIGCPYRACLGSTAMVDRDEQTRRFREDA